MSYALRIDAGRLYFVAALRNTKEAGWSLFCGKPVVNDVKIPF